MKKVYLVHGWGGSSEGGWFDWLKQELPKKGFNVYALDMPNSDTPKIEEWVNYLKENVNEINDETYFVGHSIGCQTIMRFLEKLPENVKVGGVIFVAGFFNLPYLETPEEKVIAKPWLEIPINTSRVRQHTNKFIAIFSDNDPDVPLSDKDLFKKRLDAKIIIEHNKGHFSDDAGVLELPIVLNKLLEISR